MNRRICDGWWNSAQRLLASERGSVRIPPGPAWLLDYLWDRDVGRSDALRAAYDERRPDAVCDKMLHVTVHRLRGYLVATVPAATIRSIWGTGYSLVAERDRAKRCPACGQSLKETRP